jgi:hypothetical protein
MEVIKAMEANHASQLNAMQNRLIQMERSHANRFQPRTNERWQRKGPPQDQRPPNQLEATNLVEHEAPPFCRACNDFHEESTCPRFRQINEEGHAEANNYVGYSNHINVVGKAHPVSMDYWMQTIERSENSDNVIKSYDNVTKLYGEKPTPEQILEMARYKGVTYQWKGNENPTKSYQNIPKAITPPTSELNIDLGGWMSNAKVLVPVAELIKYPLKRKSC